MTRIRMILLGVAAAIALAGLVTSSAGATMGFGNLSIGGNSCSYTFDASSEVSTFPAPSTIAIDDVREDPGCAFSTVNPGTDIDLDLDGYSLVEANGTISISMSSVTCDYALSAEVGTYGYAMVEIGGSLSRISGSSPCPNPADMEMVLLWPQESVLTIEDESCLITYDSIGYPEDPWPSYATIDNVDVYSSCWFDVVNPNTFVDLYFDGDRNVLADGRIRVSWGGYLCTYTFSGMAGRNTLYQARIKGTAAATFPCPNPSEVSMWLKDF
ncbi:MAG TPA: hypothetical protein VMF31_03860 [Solirubrobacterales bacterium]|nr:hypothetical protein [Solirubrobacterales bacterium]